MIKANTLFRFALGVFLFVFGSSCTPKSNSESVNISNGVVEINVLKAAQDVRDFPLSNLVKGVDFIVLEATAESYFSMFTSLDITEHFILIASEKEDNVLLFERTGKFLRQIGRKGRGPGEYLHPHFSCIDPLERIIIVKDEIGGNLIKYDVNGGFLKQVSLTDLCPTRVNSQPVFLDDKHFALSFNRPLIPEGNHNNIAVFDLELNLVERMLPKQKNDSLCLTNLSGQEILEGIDHHFYWESFVDTLYAVGYGKNPKPMYYFNLEGTGQPLGFLTGREMSEMGLNCNIVLGITDFPDYLFFVLFNGEGLYPMVYNKKLREAYTWQVQNECMSPLVKNYDAPKWNNDVFGFPKVQIYSLFPRGNFVTSPVYLGQADYLDLECLRKKKVLLPEKRDQLADMIEGCTGEENPLLVLMYLK